MTPASTRRSPARTALLVGAFAALTVALVLVRHGEVGLWDWDTYGRLLFIHHYRPDLWLDGHVAYHSLMVSLMAAGLGDVTAVMVLTAAGAAAFLCLLVWICRREGLSAAATGLVLAAATVGSPGLVALFLLAEDNVPYLPLVLGIFYLLYRTDGERRVVVRRGVALGGLIAVAMLINISLLVLLFPLAAAPLLAWGRQRSHAWALLAAAATALATYYLAHLVPFTGAKIALHEFLPQALAMRDFGQSSAPLLSLARAEQYLGGLRAIALTPSVHLMRLTPGLHWALLGPVPEFLLALAVCLGGWVVLFRGAELKSALRSRLALLALFGVALVFPYLYEPALIERWDVFWVGCLFALVPLLKSKPSRFVVGVVGAMVAVQGVGTGVTIAHHYGVAWADPAFVQLRSAAREVRERDSDPVVLPYSIDRLLLADLTHQAPGRTVYLVRDDGRELACFRLTDLMERQVQLSDLQQALGAGKSVYIDASLSRHSLSLLGLGPRP